MEKFEEVPKGMEIPTESEQKGNLIKLDIAEYNYIKDISDHLKKMDGIKFDIKEVELKEIEDLEGQKQIIFSLTTILERKES